MRKRKMYLAAFLAALLCMSSTGCFTMYETYQTSDASSGDAAKVQETAYAQEFETKEMDSSTRSTVAQLAAADERLTGELSSKTIKWLSDWDINPDGTGKSTPTELAVFQERYGGKVKWYQCLYDERYDQLTNYINSDEGIDFFYAGNYDAFPKGAIRGMFVPFDEYIDLNGPLWKDVKDINDSIAWKGKHYMAVTQMTGDNCAVVYNRDTVAALGLEDPAELFARGEWTWDAFENMLTAFVDLPNQKYGLDGWWFESGLSATVGIPYIGLQDGQLISNLTDGNIERVQNFMYDLYTKDCVAIGVGDFGWTACPQYIGEGKELFYPIGLWGLYSRDKETNKKGEVSGWKVTYGENAMFVPMPKDPKSEAHYIPANMESYCFVKGGSNPEGVAKYLDCKRLAIVNPEISKIADQQFKDDYGWSEEMIQMQHTMNEMAMANPVIDFKNGVSTDLAALMDDSVTGIRASAKGNLWNETLGALKDPVQTMIDEANTE